MTATLPAAPPASPVAPGAPRRRRARTTAIVAGCVVLALAAAWALARLAGGAVPADTSVEQSTEPGGLRAFVTLLESFGARVDDGTVAALAGDPDVVLVLPGVELSLDDTDRLDTWLGDGDGTVVDAAGVLPADVWAVAPPSDGGSALRRGSGCDVAALADVDRVEVVPGEAMLEALAPSVGCFRPVAFGAGPALVVIPADDRGSSRSLVVMGGVSAFTNRLLGEADNSVLATALFAPEPGSRVLLLHGGAGLPTSRGVAADGPGAGGGVGGERGEQLPGDDGDEEPGASDEDSLADHLPTGVTMGLLQLLVAFVLYAWWRGRRVGAPVSEPQPVDIEGSELVAAVGDLLARSGAPERAASRLRHDAVRELAGRLGLPAEADIEAVAAAVAARTGRPPDAVAAVLAGPDPDDGEALLALAARLDALREEVLHGVRA